jgi:hypothetical protein
MTSTAPTDDSTPKRSILQYHRPRGLLAIASAACLFLFWWMGGLLGVPEALYLDPSLATQDSPVGNFVLAAVTLVVCVVVGTLIAGTVRTDAGFFAACAGMGALAVRFGPAGQVYREAEGTGVFLWLALETVLWYGLVVGAWYVQWRLHRLGLSVVDRVRDGMTPATLPIAANILATATHAAAMCLLLVVLLRSDAKAQALASVGVASLVGSLVAHSLFATTPSYWMWLGPMVAGLIGYVMGFSTPGDWQIGHPGSPLARAMPIDYATAGPVGALIGYWMSRKWHASKQLEAISKQTVISVPSRLTRG